MSNVVNFKTKKFQLVELVVPATVAGVGSKVYFQDQAQLRNVSGTQPVYVKAIEVFSTNAATVSPLSTNPVAVPATITSSFLVLNVAGSEDLQYIPMTVLNRVPQTGVFLGSVNDLFLIKNDMLIDWTKSYCYLMAPPGILFSFLFGVHYDNVPDGPLSPERQFY